MTFWQPWGDYASIDCDPLPRTTTHRAAHLQYHIGARSRARRRGRGACTVPAWRHPCPDRSPDAEQAAAHYQQALALAEELGMRPLVAHCHLGLGRLYGQTGRVEQACAALTTAIDLYRTMDMTFWLPQAEVALAQIE
jgi:hypothetical protein